MTYNVYFGTIGKTLGIRYRYSINCKSKEEALVKAKDAATNFYYENEGKYGIPSFNKILKESNLLNIPIETLYNDHIYDMMRWYVIPTDEDTISTKELRWS